jgi:hypothetical protein
VICYLKNNYHTNLPKVYFSGADDFLSARNFVIVTLTNRLTIEMISAQIKVTVGIKAYRIPHVANSESLSGMGVNHLAFE